MLLTEHQNFNAVIRKSQALKISIFEYLQLDPDKFDYLLHAKYLKNKSFDQKFKLIIINLRRNFYQISQKSIQSQLIPFWPLFLSNQDHISFERHYRILQEKLNIKKEHLCYYFYYSQKNPRAYPPNNLNFLLQHFQVHSDRYQSMTMMDFILNRECSESFFELKGVKQLRKPRSKYENRQNFSSIIRRLLTRKKQILCILKKHSDPLIWIGFIDNYINPNYNKYLNNSKRTLIFLKLVLFIECFNFYFLGPTSPQKQNANLLLKIISQALFRIMFFIYSDCQLVNLLLKQWICYSLKKQDSVWRLNEDYKSDILIHLMAISNILSSPFDFLKIRPIQRQSLLLTYIEQLQNLCQDQSKAVSTLYLKVNTVSLDQLGSQTDINHQILEIETISIGKSLKSNIKDKKALRILQEIEKVVRNMEMNKILVLLERLLQELKSEIENLPEGQIEILYFQLVNSFRKFQKVFPNTNIIKKLQCTLIQLLKFMNICNSHNEKLIKKFSKPINFQSLSDLGWSEIIDCNQQNISLNGFVNEILVNNIFNFPLKVIYKLLVLQDQYDRGNLKHDQNININSKILSTKKQQISQLQDDFMADKLIVMINKLTSKADVRLFLNRALKINNNIIMATLFLNLVKHLLIKQKLSGFKKIMDETIRQLVQYYILNKDNKNSWVKTLLLTAHNYLQIWRIPKIQASKKKSRKSQRIMLPSQQYISTLVNLYPSKRDYLKEYAYQYQQLNFVKQALYMLNQYHRRKIRGSRIFPIQSDIWQYFNLVARLENLIPKCRYQVELQLRHNGYNKTLKQLFNVEQTFEQKLLRNFKNCTKKQKETKKKLQEKKLGKQILWQQIQHRLIFKKFMMPLKFGMLIKLNSCIVNLTQIEEIAQYFIQLKVCYNLVQMEDKKLINYEQLQKNIRQINQFDISNRVIRLLSKFQSLGQQTIRNLDELKWEQMIRHDKKDLIINKLSQKQVWQMSFQELRAAILTYYKIQDYKRVLLLYKQLIALQKDKKRKSFQQLYRMAQLQMYYIKSTINTSITFSFNKFLTVFKQVLQSSKAMIKQLKQLEIVTLPFFQLYRIACQKYTHLKPSQEKIIFKCLNQYYDCILENDIQMDQYSTPIETQQNVKKLLIQALYYILRYIFNQCTSPQLLIADLQTTKFRPETIFAHKDYLILSISSHKQKNNLIQLLLIKIAQFQPVYSSWWISSLINHSDSCGMKKKIVEEDKIIQKIGQEIKQNIVMKKLISNQLLQWMSLLNAVVYIKPSDQRTKQIYEKMINKLKKMDFLETLVSPFQPKVKLLKLNQIIILNDGKSRPKSLSFRAEKDGQICEVSFIVKKVQIDDYRIESCAANFFKQSNIVNKQVTYSIVHLSKLALLIQHVSHYDSLRAVMVGETQQIQNAIIHQRIKKGQKKLNEKYNQIVNSLDYQLHTFLQKNSQASIRQWYQRYKNFIMTFAQWSYLIYVVDLGDRHDKNILVSQDAKVIHIDFEYIFSYGLQLGYPQWVPFRMTRNIARQLSIIEPFGMFYCEFVKAALKYKSIQKQFWASLSFFAYNKYKLLDEQICKRAELKQKIYEESLKLIKQAYDHTFLKDMYIGWCSHI